MTVTYTITDVCGNFITRQADFTVKDETDPTLAEACDPEDATIECDGTNNNGNAAAAWNQTNLDRIINCADDACLETALRVESDFDFNNLNGDCGFTGEIIVTYTITDECDNDITRTATCLLYTSPSPRDATLSRMPSSA